MPPVDVRAALKETAEALKALQRQIDRKDVEAQLTLSAVESLMQTVQALAAGLRAHARSKTAHPHVHDHVIEEEDGTQWEPTK